MHSLKAQGLSLLQPTVRMMISSLGFLVSSDGNGWLAKPPPAIWGRKSPKCLGFTQRSGSYLARQAAEPKLCLGARMPSVEQSTSHVVGLNAVQGLG